MTSRQTFTAAVVVGLLAGFVSSAAQADLTEVGTAAAVNPVTEGTPPGAERRRLLVGADLFFNERIQTSEGGQAQVLFNDESSMTIGPSSDIVIDEYVYDPEQDTGELAMSLAGGVARYVGGQISKTNDVELDTPTATIGIRGGINITNFQPDGQITRTSNVFGNQTITRDGKTTDLPQGWTAIFAPGEEIKFQKTEANTVLQYLQQFEGNGTGGAEEPPTDDQVTAWGLEEDNSSLHPDLVEFISQSTTEEDDPTTESSDIEDEAETTESFQSAGAGGGGLSTFTGTALVNGFGGPAGFGDGIVGGTGGTDDGSAGPIDITSVFENGLNFGGTTFTELFANNNGNVTFGTSLGTFSPFQIDGNTGTPIIAPFFADVDTDAGSVEPTVGGNSTGANLTFFAVDPDSDTVTVTWDDVGYFSDNTDKLNAFQLQLVDLGGGDYDIVFRYEDINWTTGDVTGTDGLGGEVARAGFSADDGTNFFEFAESGNEADMLALDESEGNTGQVGVARIEVRNLQENCSCQFLNWDFWSVPREGVATNDLPNARTGSWVGGNIPAASDVPLQGTATYTGEVIGEVNSGGDEFVATGEFENQYFFSDAFGNVSIRNFDGRNLTGSVSAFTTNNNPADYSGPISGDGLTGSVDGAFFSGGGDPVAETGGQFQLQGENYSASGTFGASK